jgi:hypothetical protein
MIPMRRLILALSFVCVAATGLGCGRPFKIQTAPGFVELQNQESASPYAYRATTPEGVTVGVRVIPDEERGDLAFWSRALTLQLHDVTGYALLSTENVKSLDGTPGFLFRMGHDEGGKPYLYWLAFYMAQSRLFLVEAGGTKEQMEKAGPGVEWMMKSVKVKCSTFVSPVLASRTCNRW